MYAYGYVCLTPSLCLEQVPVILDQAVAWTLNEVQIPVFLVVINMRARYVQGRLSVYIHPEVDSIWVM